VSWSLLPNLRKTIYAPDRRDRLRLRFAASGTGWNFDSLVWERRQSIRWRAHLTLTQAEIELPNKHNRWVSEMHSFDPLRGEAILKIAEGNAPYDAERVKINYSWRRWDLVRNREIERLQECANPFEPLKATHVRAA
jgi:hypothetical protein